MTTAKPHHLAARQLMIDHLDMHPGKTVNADLDPLEAGIVPDANHRGGYHCGRSQVSDSDYSVRESSRDREGLDEHSSGIDYGYFAVTTARGTFDLYSYNDWLKLLWEAGDDDTKDLREVIYSPNGVHVKRLDKLGIRSTGDSSHQTHTHHSEFRDADGHRMVNLARRWLQHIGLLAGEGDDMTPEELLDFDPKDGKGGIPNPYNDKATNPSISVRTALKAAAMADMGVRDLNVKVNRALGLLTSLLGKDFTDEQAIVTGVLAGLDPATIAAAIPAEIAEQVAQKIADRLAA
jgi:hypothetical protein